MDEFDVAIIGGGAAGIAAASWAADLGAKACLIEKDRIGGSAFLRGVYPLRMALQNLDRSVDAKDPSGAKQDKKIAEEDFPRLFQEIEHIVHTTSERLQNALDASGVQIFSGSATLVSPTKILVRSPQEEILVTAKTVIIATGSTPAAFPTLPFDAPTIISEEDLLQMEQPPGNVAIVGDGKIAIETAALANRLAGRVFLCGESPRLLADQDPDVTDTLESVMKKQKVKLLLGKRVVSYFKDADKVNITLDGGVKFSANKIVIAGRRRPNSGELDADRLGIRLGEKGEVLIDETQATSMEGIYAIGSVTGRPASDCLAEEEARVAAGNALGKKRILNADWVPNIILTDPVIASVGCFSAQAHHKGFRGIEGRYDPAPGHLGRPLDLEQGFCKIVAEKASGKVIGAQLVSGHADTIIPIVLLAIKKGLTVNSLAMLCCGRTSEFYGLREAAKACSKALKNAGRGP